VHTLYTHHKNEEGGYKYRHSKLRGGGIGHRTGVKLHPTGDIRQWPCAAISGPRAPQRARRRSRLPYPPLSSLILPYPPLPSLILPYPPLSSLITPYPYPPFSSRILPLFLFIFSLILPYPPISSLILSFPLLPSLTIPCPPLFFQNPPLFSLIIPCPPLSEPSSVPRLWFLPINGDYPPRCVGTGANRLVLWGSPDAPRLPAARDGHPGPAARMSASDERILKPLTCRGHPTWVPRDLTQVSYKH
jgi:hypothetical protein